MGGEIIGIIYLPGAYFLYRFCRLVLTTELPDRAIYFVFLLLALGLGVVGMVSSYLPTIPENYNSSFLRGWFMICASFWITVLYPISKLLIFLVNKLKAKGLLFNANKSP